MSALTKKKYVMAEADEEVDELTAMQSVQRVLSSPGSYLFQIENEFGERSLASLPQKFRNTIWVKRNTFVICEPIFEGEKVKYEIVRVLQPENIKQLKKMKQFPLQFENGSRHAGGDGQNCSLKKEKEERDESEGDEDSDNDLPMIMNRVQVHYSDSSSDDSSDEESTDEDCPGLESKIMSSSVDQKQKEMSNKVNSAATRMDKIEQKLRCLSEEEAELYRSQLAEIKADFKEIMTENLEMQRERAAAIKTYQTEMNEALGLLKELNKRSSDSPSSS